jgi:hypothetical protein
VITEVYHGIVNGICDVWMMKMGNFVDCLNPLETLNLV